MRFPFGICFRSFNLLTISRGCENYETRRTGAGLGTMQRRSAHRLPRGGSPMPRTLFRIAPLRAVLLLFAAVLLLGCAG